MAEIPAKKDQKRADKKNVLEGSKAKFYKKVKKRGKENFEKTIVLKELYTGRKTISGPGYTISPHL